MYFLLKVHLHTSSFRRGANQTRKKWWIDTLKYGTIQGTLLGGPGSRDMQTVVFSSCLEWLPCQLLWTSCTIFTWAGCSISLEVFFGFCALNVWTWILCQTCAQFGILSRKCSKVITVDTNTGTGLTSSLCLSKKLGFPNWRAEPLTSEG